MKVQQTNVVMVAAEVEKLGYMIPNGGIVNHLMAPKLHDRRFHEMFGCSSFICAIAWMLILEGFNSYCAIVGNKSLILAGMLERVVMRNILILFVVVFRKTLGTVGQNCRYVCCCYCCLNLLSFIYYNYNTKQINSYTILLPVSFISFVSQTKINFENCKINDIGNNCLISVDGTNFELAWGANQKRSSCYKFRGKSGLQYEAGVYLFCFDLIGMLVEPHNRLRPTTDTLESVRQIVSILMVSDIVNIDFFKSTSYSAHIKLRTIR